MNQDKLAALKAEAEQAGAKLKRDIEEQRARDEAFYVGGKE